MVFYLYFAACKILGVCVFPRKHFIDRWYVLFHIKHTCIVVFVFR